MRANEKHDVREPEAHRQQRWKNGKPNCCTKAVPCPCPNHICNRRDNKNGGRLRENHCGQKQAKREGWKQRFDCVAFKGEWMQMRCRQQCKSSECNEQRLKNGHALEDIEIRARTEKQNRYRSSQ